MEVKIKPKTRQNIRALCEGAAMVALAQVLSLLKLFTLPQGGSISIDMLPILLYCTRHGLKKGLLASLALGLLQLIFDGAYAWGWTSMLFDYIVAYTMLGFAGLFHGKKSSIFLGSVAGCILRFIVHFISGVTIYRIYEPTEVFNHVYTNPYLYSAAYNSFVFIDMAICLVIFALLIKPMRRFFLGEDIIRQQLPD